MRRVRHEEGQATYLHRHVPADILPCLQEDNVEAQAAHKKQLMKLRPDFMLATRSMKKTERHIHVVEIKTCRDTEPSCQLQNAKEQHAPLIKKLVDQGYNPCNIHLVIILIGASGTIYTKHTLEPLERLGILPCKARKCASKLHKQAITHMHSIICTRRHLEHNRPSTAANPPRPP